jgi:hypothetical protein
MLATVTYSAVEARQTLLDTVVEAADEIALALAHLGDAYERLDEPTADRLEAELFGPAQVAYGRLQAAHAGFARGHGLPTHTFSPPASPVPAASARPAIDAALQAIGAADARLAELQDSMLPVEVGDPSLRTSLAEVRTLIGTLPARARELVRTLGR